MVFLQAVINPNGPAFRCFEAFESKRAGLLICPSIIAEVYDVLNRPYLRTKFKRLTPENVTVFLERILALTEHRPDAHCHFALPRDPDDEIYLNLCIENSATYLVTWNERHLTYLMHSDEPEAVDFRKRYPGIAIVNPPEFLRAMDAQS
jgi:putative PIN family toxin of toxin-antitoxin system